MRFFRDVFRQTFSYILPNIRPADIIEIILLTIILYYFFRWIKKTKSWTLLKGVMVLIVFILVVFFFEFRAIMWLIQQFYSVGLVAIVVIFQPELRRALEQLGKSRLVPTIFSDENQQSFQEEVIDAIVQSAFDMSKVKTGALIVLEGKIDLTDYIRTGITIDAATTAPLLVQIFEHNTPLHDGAVILRKGRVMAATCYLPLSDNMNVSKELGTRHRAALGLSEVSDALVVVVSEETGGVSVARAGRLRRRLNAEELREEIESFRGDAPEQKKFRLWRGRDKQNRHEENSRNIDA